MKYGGDLFRLVSHVVVLIAVTAAAAALSATGRYAFALLLLPFGGIAVYRLVRLYDASMRRVTFLLDAVENNDLNFRFCEGAASGGERALNVSARSSCGPSCVPRNANAITGLSWSAPARGC